MLTISWWALGAALVIAGAIAYAMGRMSAAERAEEMRLAQLIILRELSESGDVEMRVSGGERRDE